MGFFLDLALLLLIGFTVVRCWRRGFVRSALGTAKTLVSVILTYIFGSGVSSWLNETFIGPRVTDYVYGRFVAMFEDGAEVFDPSHIVANMPDWLRVLFDVTTADSAGTGADYAGMTEATAQQLYEMAENFAAPLANVISDLIGYVTVFVLSMLLLSVASYVLGKIADLPIIRTCDRLLGLVLGVVCAVLYASAFTLLVFGVLSLIEGSYHDFAFHDAFEGTRLFRFVYEYNIFRWIFGIG